MLELRLLGVFSIAWLLVFLVYAGILPAGGNLSLDLYRFYSIAAVLGWISGNVYQLRKRPENPKKWPNNLLVYLVGPPSILLLVRAMAPLADKAAAPFVPLYSLVVYGIFFLVPVTLAVTRTPRHRR
ncbi:MAG: hypothetical protein AAFY88_18455 [Acidobacteriota bacterium]